jgi:hypothetical protein
LSKTRAYTLLEVVIVLAFTSVLILMMIGWVSGLMSTSSTLLSATASNSDLSYLSSTFSADATSAVVCASDGLGVPWYSFSSSQVGLYEPDATSGMVDLVLWAYSGSTIQRAVLTPVNGACNFDTSNPSWVTIASNVTSVNFVPWYQGSIAQIPPIASQGGSCAGVTGSANAPDNCLFDSVEMIVTETGSTAESGITKKVSTTLDQVYPVSLSDSRLTAP